MVFNLIIVTFSGTEKVADVLIRNGADVNAANYGGWTVLHSAVNRGQLQYIYLLYLNVKCAYDYLFRNKTSI